MYGTDYCAGGALAGVACVGLAGATAGRRSPYRGGSSSEPADGAGGVGADGFAAGSSCECASGVAGAGGAVGAAGDAGACTAADVAALGPAACLLSAWRALCTLAGATVTS